MRKSHYTDMPVTGFRFFKGRWFNNSYRAVAEFQKDLLEEKICDMKSGPVYDPKTGKLSGWKLLLLVERECGFSPVPREHFFKERLFRDSYKAMCRFKNDLLARQNENTK